MSFTTPPTTFSPVASQELFLAVEAQPGAAPSSLGYPFPFTSFKPSNKPTWIDDESFQGSMGDIYGVYQGPEIASWDAGGHMFADTFPMLAWAVLGDYTATGTATGSPTTLSAAVEAGATTATVTSATGITAGTSVQLEASSAVKPEVLTVASVASTTLTFTTPVRFAHASAVAVQPVLGPYTHVFALLNGSVGSIAGPGQPPTLCATHMNGISANGGDVFAYSAVSELVLTGNADKLLDWTAKATCLSRQEPSAALATEAVSAEQAVPSWRTTVGWGGTVEAAQVNTISEHTITISRAVAPVNTEQGSQDPFVIARGKQSNTGKVTITPAIDDSTLTAMLSNAQPQLQFVSDNGLSGTSHRLVQVDILLAALDTADINDGKELFGYDASFKAVHTAATAGGISMAGASGGKGAVKITVVNNTPTYMPAAA